MEVVQTLCHCFQTLDLVLGLLVKTTTGLLHLLVLLALLYLLPRALGRR